MNTTRSNNYDWLTAPIILLRRHEKPVVESNKFIVLPGERKTFVFVATITRIEADGGYSRIYTTDGKTYLVARTLLEFTSRLDEFLRVHKSHLVNPDYIISKRVMRCVGKPHSRYVRLLNGDTVPVSRRVSFKICAAG
ncbi:LytTR family DNA-binding domain-containing protein [Larkinella sp. C7]|uniref:LytR/AlgR family response regulator transcription factor n=1 Tax=Larkinella sp. C7 TaxID=2576607 RepID=UPI001111386E|nr:LytTR family DNA-binding domain-containing protein [Larkinella sp. C7]